MSNRCETGVFETEGYHGGIRVAIPYVRVTGCCDGPQATIMAAQHGRELNGIESIRRAIAHVREAPSLTGTCVFVPVANPLAAPMRQQDYPFEYGRYFAGAAGFNLNRVWPGRADGSLYAAMAKAIWDGAIRQSRLCIDLHGWTGRSTSLLWGYRRDAAFVRSVGFDIHMLVDDPATDAPGGVSECACYRAGILPLVAELTPQNVLSEPSIRLGLRTVLNALRRLGMLDEKPDMPPRQIEFTARNNEHVVKADRPGLFVPSAGLLDMVEPGDALGAVVSLGNVLDARAVTAPAAGTVFNIGGPIWAESRPDSALVEPGDTVALVREVADVIRY